MTIKVIFLDFGHTLIHDKNPWRPIFARADDAMVKVLQEAGIPLDRPALHPDCETVIDIYQALRGEDFIEHTTYNVLRDLLAERGYRSVPDPILRAALDAMYAITQTNWYAEDDALPMLHSLQKMGFHLGMISNAGDDKNVQQLVDQFGFRPLFDFVITSAACGIRKPHPRIFQLALEHFDIAPDQAMMIGDSLEADIQGANDLGIYSIWITRRAEMPPDGELGIQPMAVIPTLSELPPLLASIQA